VYKILQSRLRRNASQPSQNQDCDGCRKSTCQKSADEHMMSQSHKRRRTNSAGGEDPMSHKIIEKRRRDRMNSCLADLSHLIPSNYLKKGRGRIEKTEIVEMAIKHIKYLHSIVPTSASITGNETTEISADVTDTKLSWRYPDDEESFKNGFNDCVTETVHFLVDQERIPPENPLCTRLVNHLKSHLDQRGGPQKPCKSENVTGDSDYCSVRSDSATNSEVGSQVGSIVSNQSSLISNRSSNTSSYIMGQTTFHPHPLPSTSQGSTRTEASFSSKSGKMRKIPDDHDMSSGKYKKFKDSIRDRFSSEFESLETSRRGDRTRDMKDERQSESRKSFQTWSADEPKTHKVKQSHHVYQDTPPNPNEMKKMPKQIPTFALHPKGTHYIPMPIGEDVIQPYLHLFDQGPDVPLMLHPITISVNFCGPIQMAASFKPVTTKDHGLTAEESSLLGTLGPRPSVKMRQFYHVPSDTMMPLALKKTKIEETSSPY